MSESQAQQLSLPWTSSVVVSHAKTSAPPASEPASAKAPARAYGSSSAASSPSSGRASSSSRTSRAAHRSGSRSSSETFGSEAIERALSRFRRETSALPISDEGSSSSPWPTATASETKRRVSPKEGAQQVARAARACPGGTLSGAMWPTATATDAKASGSTSAYWGRRAEGSQRHEGLTLTDATVRSGLFATATATRWHSQNNGNPKDGRERYATAGTLTLDGAARVDGGRLNPDWVEMLMGFPAGWTVIDSPEPEGSSGASGSHRR